MKNSSEHCLEAIHGNVDSLGPAELEHIESCSRCRMEYEIYRRLESAVRNLPTSKMPADLRQRILDQIILPGYRMRHLVAALFLACLAPLMLLFFDVRVLFGPGLTISLFGGSGILIALLMIPITHYVFIRHRLDVNLLKNRLDELLEKRAF